MFRNKFQVKRMQNEQVMRILVLKWGGLILGITVAYGAHRKLRWVLGI